ncbi:semaphorin-6D isoform X1 [Xyrauchen texanus]|uniref:semaphorin-6D isoform X1 n=1 Tax=Xyrauchen texanus TaxID=154827 RepID=UPI0022425AAF|nr:semaphorin-6D isoform X1 [Xyrauchen texanus]XP_051991790.1 semaphorin-6D isoform X1 [Xyrauchen texanus]
MTDRTWLSSIVMAMVFLAYLFPVVATATPFPRDLQPISVVGLEDSHLYPSFQGVMSENGTKRLILDYQRMIRIHQMLYIAARDHVFVVNLTTAVDQFIPQQILTWRSTDVSKCTVRGRNSDECYNYIKVLVPRNDETLFMCGTNALNPACRNYRLSTLEQVGQQLLGQARCPFESRQSNVGLFAAGNFYSATVTDFQASDAVIYRSLGGEGRPVLRTVKYDSKWLREPHFLHAVEYGNYVYFFFIEIAVEHTAAGKVVYSRVARVCKNDSGGSTRVLDRYWTSFLKARLNCSVPGETFFYFDVLQSLTNVLQINQRPAVIGVFTTQINSIPGSAICGFYLDDIERVFNGKFKEQKNSDSVWTSVPEEHVPKPRPGLCAGEGSASSFSSSVQFPDSVLSFIKTHPLMDECVPPVNNQPLITNTASRYKLTQIVVDTTAGPHKNRTVVFLGSEDGRVLKILTGTQANSSHSSKLLEEMDVYNPTQCNGDRRILGLELDKEHHALFVAFSSCIIRVPLSRCARHATCKRRCLSTHDPYCIWLRTGRCADVAPGFKAGFEQDIDGEQIQLPDACNDVISTAVNIQNSPLDSVSGVKQSPAAESLSNGYHFTLLGACVLVAFVLGSFVSGLLVSCYCSQRARQTQEPEASPPNALSLNSLAKLNHLMDAKPDKSDVTSSQMYSLGPPCRQTPIKPHDMGETSGASGREELILTLPTPDLTPELPIKNIKASNNQWERSHAHNTMEGSILRPTLALTQQVFPVTQSVSINQTLPWKHTPSEGYKMQNEVGGATVMTSSLLPGDIILDPGSYSRAMQSTSYYSCLTLPRETANTTAESTAFKRISLQTLPGQQGGSREPVSYAHTKRHVLIKMGNGITTARQHSFNHKAVLPPPSLSAHSGGNIYEIHRPLIVGGSCLTRQHSYSEPPHLQKAAIIRRTASLKPQIPPKPVNIRPKTLLLPSAAHINTHGNHNY